MVTNVSILKDMTQLFQSKVLRCTGIFLVLNKHDRVIINRDEH
jgi:hypothetical protein